MTVDEKALRSLTYSMANAKLGEGPAVRCEGPTEYELDQARPWARRALNALAYGAAKPVPASGRVDVDDVRSQTEMLLLAILAGDPASELKVRVNDILTALAPATEAKGERA